MNGLRVKPAPKETNSELTESQTHSTLLSEGSRPPHSSSLALPVRPIGMVPSKTDLRDPGP